ncbi:MAG: ABC transporter permease [Acidobacteriota bacterium]|nr:ABC transporter permease [Acidobacteriota bacterium]
MKKQFSDIFCVFQIHLARLRREIGPFLLAAIVFPIGMYLFASGIANQNAAQTISNDAKLHFLAASIVFSLSLTSISWLGYLMLENRFTGRLKLFATLPLAASSYVFGVLIFALVQGALGTISMLSAAKILGVETQISGIAGALLLALTNFVAILSLCGVSVIIAARVRSFSEGSLYTDALGAGLVLLAPVYYSAETLPSILRWLGYILPTTYIAEAINKILAGNLFVGTEISILVLMAVITLGSGFRLMNWREE